MKLRIGFFVALCLVTSLLGGCAVFDWLFRVQPDGTQGPDSPASGAGSLLNLWIPGASAILTGIGGVYAAIRGRKWKQAAISTFDTINEASETEIGKEAIEKLKNRLSAAHSVAGVGTFVENALDALEKSKRPHAPPPPGGRV